LDSNTKKVIKPSDKYTNLYKTLDIILTMNYFLAEKGKVPRNNTDGMATI